MSARGFGSVLSAGAVVGAALGFYLVSLRVASERAALEEVEASIAMTQRDIRLLQTEIGTRGRLAQLERWNVRFIRLSAPNADQFVDGGFQLATLVAPRKTPAIDAPVVLAAAPMAQSDAQPRETGDAIGATSRPVSEMIHVASYTLPQVRGPAMAPTKVALARPEPPAAKPPVKPGSATKPPKTATADPLAPLPVHGTKAKGSPPAAPGASGTPNRKLKDSVTD